MYCVPALLPSTSLLDPKSDRNAQQLEEKRAQMDDRQFEQFVSAVASWQTFQCTCAVRKNEYKGVTSRRINLHSMRRINYAAEARRMLSEIQNMA